MRTLKGKRGAFSLIKVIVEANEWLYTPRDRDRWRPKFNPLRQKDNSNNPGFMSQLSLPRYFVSRSEGQSSGASPDEVLPPDHVIDSFFIGARHLAERELAVAVDAAGNLQTLSLESD